MKTKKSKMLAMSCVAATLVLSNATWAQVTAEVETKQDVPTAEQVIADYIKATGGEEAHRAVKSVVSEGELSIPEVGLEGEVKIHQAAPNLMLMEISLPQIGEQKTGYNGKVGWSLSDMQGAEVIEGERLSQIKLQGLINQYLDMAEHFSDLECTGEEEFNDEACYVVVASNGEGSEPIVSFFSKKTKLLVGSKVRTVTPQGKMDVVSYVSDYKEVGGVKMSHKAVAKVAGMSQVVKMTKIAINEEIPESAFALPEEVQELVDDE